MCALRKVLMRGLLVGMVIHVQHSVVVVTGCTVRAVLVLVGGVKVGGLVVVVVVSELKVS